MPERIVLGGAWNSQIPMRFRPLAAVEKDIQSWCDTSTRDFRSKYVETDRAWVLKYIPARFLKSFLSHRRMTVSATPGFTWGDGVYVTPLRHPYSTMMYGRAGVMGWLQWAPEQKAYDATGRGSAGLRPAAGATVARHAHLGRGHEKRTG